MEILIDLAIVAFIPFMIFCAYHRGAIYTVFTLISIILSFSAAVFFSVNLSEPVGRLIQPVVKKELISVLENALRYENIIIETPVPSTGNESEEEEEVQTLIQPEYLSMVRALQLLKSDRSLDKWRGFVEQAENELYAQAYLFSGSVTVEISSVMGEEMARVCIFIMVFCLLFSMWLLLTRRFKVKFEGDTALIHSYVGAFLGFIAALLLIYVFAWITKGTILSSSSVTKTVLYEFFAKNTPLDLIAGKYMVLLDL